MLEQIKQWIEHRRGGKIGSHDPGNLPNPKTPGEQLLTDCRLIVLDLEGHFLDVQLIEHNEPIFVSGLGEAPFHKFFE